MAPIDRILAIVVEQQSTELRLGTDRAPRMFQRGTQKKLSIPETSDDVLRHLLGNILSTEREGALRAAGKLDFAYDAGALGAFHVALVARAAPDPGFDVTFVRGSARGAQPAAPAASAPAPPAPAPAPVAIASPVFSAPALASPPAREPESASRLHAAPETEAASELLTGLLARAAELRASDLHLADGATPMARVDGRLRALDGEAPARVEGSLLAPCLDARSRERLAEGRSADVAFEAPGVGRFRVNVYRSAEGMAAAVRLLARSAPVLVNLRLPVAIDDLVDLPHGLVIVCGPTGSGKSSTLAALAREALQRRSIVLLGLEDPIEYVLSPGPSSLVRQRQIGRDVRDFATGLRDALREDPDVLLIGEMRDPETIGLALTAAETGHLVLTSLHSRSAASAIERIVDAYGAEQKNQIRAQLSESLRAIVAQRLLPRAKGPSRVAALEVLRASHSVSSLVREGKTAQLASVMQSSRREGMIPLERCLAELVKTAQVTPEAARAVANDVVSLDMYLRGQG